MNLEENEESWKEQKQKFGIELGKRIRDARIAKGMTQRQVTENAGFYRTYIGLIENGKYSPSVFTVWRIAKAMDIELEDLVSGL